MSKSKYKQFAIPNPDWREARIRFERYYGFDCKPTMKRLKADHIEDEDKSVKWNRQFIEDNHQKYDEAVKDLNRKKNTLRQEAENFVKYMIGYELDWKLSDDDIDRYYNCWYERYHDDGLYSMMSSIESECDFIRNMDWWSAMKEGK